MKNVVVDSPSRPPSFLFPLPFCDERYSHAQWLADGLELGRFLSIPWGSTFIIMAASL